MNVLITGINGASASYLVEYISTKHPRVHLSGIAKPWCDLNDLAAVIRTLKKERPDRIFHLAAMPHVHESYALAYRTLQNNILGTQNLFDAMEISGSKARVLVTSSCEVYGHPQYSPMDELHPLSPVSPYGVSKCAVDLLSQMYAKRGMDIVVTRGFNWINPKATRLFSTMWARQVAMIEKGKATELVHGNLDSARTLADIRDIVRAYWLALEHGSAGDVFNIGVERETMLREFIDILRNKARCEIPLRQDPSLMRPIDITTQVSDSREFIDATGWEPQYTLDQSVDMLLDYWRKDA